MRAVLFVILPLLAAAVEPPITEVVAGMPVPAGWAVHVGASDGAIERALVATGGFVVTGLAYESEIERSLRAALASEGLAGRAAIHRVLADHRLPLATRTVALLVVSPGAKVTASEIDRVLRPGGRALVAKGGSWQIVEPEPVAGLDDWTHFNYDASASDTSRDTVVGPMKSLRWLSGDPFQSDIIGQRFSRGVMVGLEHNSPGGRSIHPPTGTIVARDAFSGVELWRREGFYVQSRYAFTLDAERVYLHAMDARHFVEAESWRAPYHANPRPLVAFNLFTGDDAVVYDQGLVGRTAPTDRRQDPVAVQADLMTALVHDGRLIQRFGDSVAVLDPATGAQHWRATVGGKLVGMIACDGERVIGLVGPDYHRATMGYLGHTPIFTADSIIAWDLASGEERWRVTPDALAASPHSIRLAVGDGHVGVISYQKYKNVGLQYLVSCYRADNGQQVWTQEGPKKVMGGGHYARPQIHQGRLWATGASGAVGWHLADGSDELMRVAGNFRCSTNRATPAWFISSQQFHHIASGQAFFTEATRGRPRATSSCPVSTLPARGDRPRDATSRTGRRTLRGGLRGRWRQPLRHHLPGPRLACAQGDPLRHATGLPRTHRLGQPGHDHRPGLRRRHRCPVGHARSARHLRAPGRRGARRPRA